MLQVGDGTRYKAIEGENQDDATDDAVDEPHRADVEMGAHLVNKEGNNRPPDQRPHHNKGVAQDDVVEFVFRQGETESGKQGNDQEHDERIAQGEQETCYRITPVVLALINVLGNLADGIVDDHVNGIDDKDDTADNLQDIHMVGNEIGDQRNTQAHQQAVKQVAGSSTHTRKETGIAPLVQRALNTQDTYRTHRCRQDDTY